MPYILSKRSDFDPGTLYIQDLRPNTSQMNIYRQVGQTGYERDPATAAVTTQNVGGVITTTSAGIGIDAWQLVSASSGSGAAAKGTIVTAPVASLLDGETITITDGTTSKVFEFMVTAGVEITPGNVLLDVTAAVTATDVRDVLIAAINAEALYNITAAIGAAAIVALTNTDENILAALRNVVITDTVAAANVQATATATSVNAPISQPGTTEATGTMTVVNSPLSNAGAGDLLTINGQPLIAAAGARTPGANDFNGAAGTQAAIATDMIAAINDPANAFVAIATAATGGAGIVALTAVPLGVAGNAITLTKTLTTPADVVLSGANLAGGADADFITIGGQILVSVNGARTPGANDFDGSTVGAAAMEAEIIAAINDATNGFAAIATAATGGAGIVALTSVPVGTLGNAITLTKTLATAADIVISGANFAGGTDGVAVTGMAGATASTALTAAQATTNTTAVMALMNYNAVGTAGAMNLAAINGAMVTGSITESQLSDFLDILAGRDYTVPAGTQIQAAAVWTVVGTSGFDDANGPIRSYYDTTAFRISWEEGVLFQLRQDTYSFGGTVMAAVAVYNDDGSLYT